jgi:hypothetical protein
VQTHRWKRITGVEALGWRERVQEFIWLSWRPPRADEVNSRYQQGEDIYSKLCAGKGTGIAKLGT